MNNEVIVDGKTKYLYAYLDVKDFFVYYTLTEMELNVPQCVPMPNQDLDLTGKWYDRANSTLENPIFRDPPFWVTAKADSTQVSVNKHETMSLQEWMDAHGVVTGSYTGNGSNDPRTIPLDFTPSAVLVIRNDGLTRDNTTICGGLAVTGKPVQATSTDKAVEITENGFIVYRGSSCVTNASLKVYNYIALS